MSRSGEAIYSCSKPQCSSERGDSETTTGRAQRGPVFAVQQRHIQQFDGGDQPLGTGRDFADANGHPNARVAWCLI